MAELLELYKNLPNITVRLYEGSATVADKHDQAGNKIERTLSWASELRKGDFVKFYTTNNASRTVQAIAANDDDLIGVIISDPEMGSPITASASLPTAPQRRKATLALFGADVVTLASDGAAAIPAGATVGHSNIAAGRWKAGTEKNVLSLDYVPGVAGTKFAALLGYFGYVPDAA